MTAIATIRSGTGASMVANKVKGIRAALCSDVETAKLARVWNHANVLVLSNRLLNNNNELVDQILQTWFDENIDVHEGENGVKELQDLESKKND